MQSDTAIIGAGLSGLAAALVLLERGRSVQLIDKGRGIGGRLATRRIGDATLDHGAQFFTVRGAAFRSVVDRATADGVVDIWCHGFGDPDGYPRYRSPKGMNSFAKWLAAQVEEAGGVITKNERVSAVTSDEEQWSLPVESGTEFRAKNLIITAPVPQTLTLIRDGGIELEPAIESALSSITYKPTFALLVTLDSPGPVPPPGALQRTEDDLFTFIADNQKKGISAAPAMTFHVNGQVSAQRWDDDKDAIIADLLQEAQPWIGEAVVENAQLQKWRYAGPLVSHPDPCVIARREPGYLVVAGDAFAGPKVEGAFNSGQAAGHALPDS